MKPLRSPKLSKSNFPAPSLDLRDDGKMMHDDREFPETGHFCAPHNFFNPQKNLFDIIWTNNHTYLIPPSSILAHPCDVPVLAPTSKPPTQKPGIKLVNSHSFQRFEFNITLETFGSTQVLYVCM